MCGREHYKQVMRFERLAEGAARRGGVLICVAGETPATQLPRIQDAAHNVFWLATRFSAAEFVRMPVNQSEQKTLRIVGVQTFSLRQLTAVVGVSTKT
jgi:hypothetical protein